MILLMVHLIDDLHETEHSNLNAFNMITRLKTCDCKYKCDGKNLIQIKNRVAANVEVTVKIQ